MDEYVSRETVNNIIEDMRNNHFILMSERINLALLKSKVAEIPAADVQPVKRGKWIWSELPEFGNPYGSYICSECKSRQAYRENFCLNCGARMDGETNDCNDK